MSELTAYAVRVAGTVGEMMALVMGVRTSETLARACDLGVAMQFSNIARDLGEDAREGRLYLPLQWLREGGISPEGWLAAPVSNPAIDAVVRRLLAEAATLYARADAGIAALPLSCQPGIRAARLLYAEIGEEVARRGCDSVTVRAVVPMSRKLLVLVRGLALRSHEAGMGAPFADARQQPVPIGPAGVRLRDRPRWAALEIRPVFVIELFQRLAEREQLGTGEL